MPCRVTGQLCCSILRTLATLEHKKALLSALDELDSHVKHDPLVEEVEHLKLEESELKELHSALQKEESLQLFLEKMNELQLWLHMLRLRQLPEPERVEIHPGMEKVLQDTCSATEIGRCTRSTPQSYTWLTKAHSSICTPGCCY